MYFDAHTHLNSNQLFQDRKQHLEDFCEKGGKGLVNVGVNDSYNTRALEIASQRKSQDKCLVKAAIGYHPCIVDEQSLQRSQIPSLISNLRSQISGQREHIVAIGEIGVDLYRGESKETKLIQQSLFDAQCHLASELELPIVIHSRAAFDETMEVLNLYPTLDIYFHCRGYSPTALDKLSTFFGHCWTGFCANISYPKAQELRDSLGYLIKVYGGISHFSQSSDPAIRLLLETDAPYLAIQADRGQTQTPAKIRLLCDYISQLIGIEKKILQSCIGENFHRLYKTLIQI